MVSLTHASWLQSGSLLHIGAGSHLLLHSVQGNIFGSFFMVSLTHAPSSPCKHKYCPGAHFVGGQGSASASWHGLLHCSHSHAKSAFLSSCSTQRGGAVLLAGVRH